MADELGKIPMSSNLQATLIRARDYAAGQTHAEVTLEHLLLSLSEDEDAVGVMQSSRIDLGRLRNDIASYLGDMSSRMPAGTPGAPAISTQLTEVLRYATLAAKQGRRGRIDGAIVLAALVGDGRSMAASFLKAQGLTFEEAIRALQRSAAQPAPAALPHQRPRPEPPPGPGSSHSAPGPLQAEDILAAARERVTSRTGQSPRIGSSAGGPAPQVSAPLITDASPVELTPHEQAPPTIENPPPHGAELDETPAHTDGADAPEAEDRPLPGTVAAAAAAAAAVAPGAAADADSLEPPLTSLESALGRGTAGAPDASSLPPAPAPSWSPPPLPAPRPAAAATQVAASPRPAPDRAPSPTPGPPASSPPRPLALDAPPPGYRTDAAPEPPLAPPAPYDAGQRAAQQPRPYTNGSAGYGQPPAPAVPGPPAGAYPYHSAAQRGRPGADAPRAPAIDASQISHTIPARLQIGQRVQVEVRVGRNPIAGLMSGPKPTATLSDFAAARAISVRLRALKPGLVVEAVSPETQWDQAAGQTGRLAGDAAVWRFTITAQATGARDLQLLVAARTIGADGVIADMVVPEQTIAVAVPRNWLATLGGVAGKLGLIAGAILVLELARAFLNVDLGRLAKGLFGF